MDLKRILKKAEKEKFGRSQEDRWQKTIFLRGVRYAIQHLGGEDILKAAGYGLLAEK